MLVHLRRGTGRTRGGGVRVRHRALLLLALGLTGIPLGATAATPTDQAPDPVRATDLCFGAFVDPRPDDTARAAKIMNGRLGLPGHAEVRLPADPTWHEAGEGTANWAFQYHSLTWIDVLRRVGTATSDRPMLARYQSLLRDWTRADTSTRPYAWMDMTVALRALTFSCALPVLGPQPWLLRQLELHGADLADPRRYAGVGNHAMHQNNALLVLGEVTGRPDRSRLALRRNRSLLLGAVDPQGVNGEGSIGYQRNNYVWAHDALAYARVSGHPMPDVEARVRRMPEFLAQATGPDSRYELIGDTLDGPAWGIPGTQAQFAATAGRWGVRPTRTLAAYRAGYLFQRSGWGTERPFADETFYSMRFGPAVRAQVHGHADAGSLTLASHGGRLLWDQGLYAYYGGRMRTYVRSAIAHNRVTVDRRPTRSDAPATPLTRLTDTPRATTAQVVVRDIPGSTWTRTVLYSKRGRYLVVRDRVVSARPDAVVAQRWHLGADRTVTVRPGLAFTSGPGADVSLLWLEPPSLREVRGRRSPLLGWRSLEHRSAVAVPVVEARRRGSTVDITTVIVPRGSGVGADEVRLSRVTARGPVVGTRVHVGGLVETVRIGPRGGSVT